MSLLPVALQTSSASSTPQKDWATQNFVPPPVTEKSNWMHEVSLRSFSVTAISASWFSSSCGWSLSGAVFHATTSRIRHSSHVVNTPCLRVPNLLSRIPTVKQIEPLLSAIRAVIHKPSRCQSTDTCPSHQFLVSTPKFTPRLMSDASSRDKIQTVYSDGRRCDHSSPRCGVSVKCPQCGLFCENVVRVELLESVVFEQKDGCTRMSFRVHSNQPVLPQGFVLRSFRDQTSRRNVKDRLRTRACHSNNPCAEDRGLKKHKKSNQNLNNATRQWKAKCASCSSYKRQKLGAGLSWNNIKNSALARPISGLTFIVSTVARDLPVSPSVPLSSVPRPKASLSLLRGGLSSLFILSRKPDCLLVSTKCERGLKSQTSENLTLGELHNAECQP